VWIVIARRQASGGGQRHQLALFAEDASAQGVQLRAEGASIVADQYDLPFRASAFDTVACDPIYGLEYPLRIYLQREIARVARRRIIFKAPWIPRASGWELVETVLIGSHTCANVAVLSLLEFRP